MGIARFKPNGGPVSAEIVCTFAQSAHYTLRLWDIDNITIVKKVSGDTIDAGDDIHEMPLPTAEHDQRKLNCSVVITLIPPVQDYRLEMVVKQDGLVIGGDMVEGRTEELTVNKRLDVQLVADGGL